MRLLLTLLACLLALPAWALKDLVVERVEPAPHLGLVDWKVTGPIDQRVNIVIAPEGYTTDQLGSFALDAQRLWSAMFGIEPWKANEHLCSGFLNRIPSAKSGVGGVFGSYYVGRRILLAPSAYTTFWGQCSNRFASFNQIVPIILVNSSTYGGSGGVFAVASTHKDSGKIAIHEVCHLFGLEDEYPTGWKLRMPNVAIDLTDIPWQPMIAAKIVGQPVKIEDGRWRPGPACLMHSLSANAFCPVCREHIHHEIQKRSHAR